MKNWYKNIDKILNILKMKNEKSTKIIGILGPQGIGKSTIGKIISESIIKKMKKKSISISLDDFYLTYKERKEKKIKFRGPPGTHDFKKLRKFINDIRDEKIKELKLPIFNKGLFKGKGDFEGYTYIDKPDFIIWEGWFNGLLPVYNNFIDNKKKSNSKYINNSINDNKSIINIKNDNKNYSCINLENDSLLKKYVKFWDFYILIILRPVDFKYSFEWRMEAEKKNKDGKMSDEEIKEFVKYFLECLNPDIYYDYLLEYRRKNSLKTILFLIDKKHEIIDSEFINF